MSNEIKSIQMPKWGMEMSEGEINAWHVEIGAQVNAEDDLVDVETSKIINTVTAAHSGVSAELLLPRPAKPMMWVPFLVFLLGRDQRSRDSGIY